MKMLGEGGKIMEKQKDKSEHPFMWRQPWIEGNVCGGTTRW